MGRHLRTHDRFLLAGTAAALLLAGCEEQQTEEAERGVDGGGEPPAAAPAGELEARRDVFAAHCAQCHGASGQGAFGPRLAGGAVVERYPDIDDHRAVVVNGSGMMPAFGETTDRSGDRRRGPLRAGGVVTATHREAGA